MYRRFVFLFSIAFTISFCWSCSDSGTDNGNKTVVFPAKNVSYATHVQPYFYLSCATSGCHDDRTMAGNPPLSLTSYFNATANPGIIIPGDPASSLLIQKVDGRLPHDIFVPIVINDNQLQGLKTWIQEGALNN